MNSLLAIAAITIRSAIRSRVLLAMIALLAIAVVGLPLTVKGDGTAGGHTQMLMSYTLGFAGILLAISTVWAGAAAVSSEIREKQIQLVVTKPVRAWEIWTGKWLGLLALNAVLLAFAGVTVYGLLAWQTRPAALTAEERRKLDEEILVARLPLRPEQPDIEARARGEWDRRLAQGPLPADIKPADAWKALRTTLLAQEFAVAPGGARSWTVRRAAAPSDRYPTRVEFRFSSSEMDLAPVPLRWTLTAGSGEGVETFTVTNTWSREAVHSFALPPGWGAGSADWTLECANFSPQAATIFFDPEKGIEVLLHHGTFAGNFARSLLLLFFRLAFLAALGLTAGSLLSMPVATFVSLFTVVCIRLSGYLQSMAGEEQYIASEGPQPSALVQALNAVMHAIFVAVSTAVKPLLVDDPLQELASGRLVPWTDVAQVFGVHAVLYGGLLALLCAWALPRRELGLPNE